MSILKQLAIPEDGNCAGDFPDDSKFAIRIVKGELPSRETEFTHGEFELNMPDDCNQCKYIDDCSWGIKREIMFQLQLSHMQNKQ